MAHCGPGNAHRRDLQSDRLCRPQHPVQILLRAAVVRRPVAHIVAIGGQPAVRRSGFGHRGFEIVAGEAAALETDRLDQGPVL
ncbi:MAG: hypothetical protein ACK559_26660, partial [bacterium]